MTARRKSLQRLLGYARKHTRAFLLGGLLLLITNGLQTAFPWYLKEAIEAVRTQASESQLLRIVLTLLAVALLQGVARIFSRTIVYQAGRSIESELRDDVFAHLSRLSPSFYDQWRTGEILSRATNDTSDVRMFLGAGFLQIWNTVFVYITTVGMMLIINPSLTLYALVPFPVLAVFFNRMSRRMHQHYLTVQQELGSLSTNLQESLSGIFHLKAYNREAREAEVFAEGNRRYTEANLSLEKMAGVIFPTVGAVAGLGTVVLLYLGGQDVVAGRITLGEFVAFNAYLGLLLWPTIGLGWILNVLERGLAAMGRLDELLDQVPSITDPPEVIDVLNLAADLELRDLTFQYEGADGNPGPEVLKGISANIPAGATCAIVGGTGSGKTTLVHLMARLYEVGEGQIFIGGHDVTRLSLSQLRRAFAFVPQDNYLFSISLGENLAYGLPEMDWDRVKWASAVSRLEKDIPDLPQGFDTIVGERGVMLSGGQRQRACIARALTRDAQIVVIDDALSAVDTATEEEILSGLKKFMHGKTSILISHRVSTVKWADQILVLEEGRLVEQGTHRQLIARGGIYAGMAARQALSDQIDSSPPIDVNSEPGGR